MDFLIILFLLVCVVHDYGIKQEIKYDLRDQKRWWIVAWIFTGMLLLTAIGCFLFDIMSISNEILAFVLCEMFFSLPILVLIAWLQYMNCFQYLKRLCKYGYELPENKNIYGRRLERLPRKSQVSSIKWCDNKDSKILAGVSWIMTFFVGCGAVIYAVMYGYMPDVVKVSMFAYGFVGLIWFGAGVFFWRQRLYSRYRDDVETDAKRKHRVHLIPGMAVILFMLFVTIVGFVILDQFALVCRTAREQVQVEAVNVLFLPDYSYSFSCGYC